MAFPMEPVMAPAVSALDVMFCVSSHVCRCSRAVPHLQLATHRCAPSMVACDWFWVLSAARTDWRATQAEASPQFPQYLCVLNCMHVVHVFTFILLVSLIQQPPFCPSNAVLSV